MRPILRRILALALVMVVPSAGRPEPDPPPIQFGLDVFALADGPCVLCLTMTNIGREPVTLMGWSDEAILADVLSPAWWPKSRVWLETGPIGPGMRFYSLKPQETHRAIISLHHDFEVISVASEIQIKAKFRWDVSSSEGRTPVQLDFSRKLTVKPKENTPANRVQMVAHVTEFGKTLPAEERANFYRDCIEESKVAEFLPLALETARISFSHDTLRLIWWILEAFPEDEFWKLFEKEGISATSPNPSVWLSCVRHNNDHPVGDLQYRMMRATPNLLARLAAAFYFPKCFTPTELRNLFAEAAQWKPPVREEELKDDVQRLASDSFRQRELAAVRLRAFGEQGVSPLYKILESAADQEVRSRLKAIIEQGKNTRPSPGEEHFFQRLAVETDNRPVRVAILTALAKNDPSSRITKLAEKALKEMADFEKFRAGHPR